MDLIPSHNRTRTGFNIIQSMAPLVTRFDANQVARLSRREFPVFSFLIGLAPIARKVMKISWESIGRKFFTNAHTMFLGDRVKYETLR